MTCPSLKFTLPRRKFNTKAHALHLRSRSPPAPHFYNIKLLIIFCSDRMKSNRYQRHSQNTITEMQSYCCPSRNQTSSNKLFFQHEISRCTPSCCSPHPFSSPQQRCKKSKTLHTNCSRRCGAMSAAAPAAAAAAAVSDSLSTFRTCTSASSRCNAAKQLQMLRCGPSQRNHIVIHENTAKATEQKTLLRNISIIEQ